MGLFGKKQLIPYSLAGDLGFDRPSAFFGPVVSRCLGFR